MTLGVNLVELQASSKGPINHIAYHSIFYSVASNLFSVDSCCERKVQMFTGILFLFEWEAGCIFLSRILTLRIYSANGVSFMRWLGTISLITWPINLNV